MKQTPPLHLNDAPVEASLEIQWRQNVKKIKFQSWPFLTQRGFEIGLAKLFLIIKLVNFEDKFRSSHFQCVYQIQFDLISDSKQNNSSYRNHGPLPY